MCQHTHIAFNIFSTNFNLVSTLASSIPKGHEVIIGGLATKSLFNEIAKFKSCNTIHIVSGEADFALSDIVNGIYSSATNRLSAKAKHYTIDKYSVYYPKNLDMVNLNRETLSQFGVVKNKYGQREASLISSRGCIYDCTFCGAAKNIENKTTARMRSMGSIESEIANICRHQVDSIRVLDDLFLRDNGTIEQAAALFSKLGIGWRAMAHINSFREATGLIYESLAKGNCKELFCGIESGSPRVIKSINKRHTPEIVIHVISNILYHGIDVKCYFIYGFPDEDYSDMQKTFTLAKTLKRISMSTHGKMRASVFKFRPYHGTKIYKQIYGDKIITSNIAEDTSLAPGVGKRHFNFKAENHSSVDDTTLNKFIKDTLDYCNNQY